MKKIGGVYTALIFVIMYLPLIVMMVFSFKIGRASCRERV